jgi:hypothetical protein
LERQIEDLFDLPGSQSLHAEVPAFRHAGVEGQLAMTHCLEIHCLIFSGYHWHLKKVNGVNAVF